MTSTSTAPRALVTGASSGIGAAFADRLARDGFNLILVARRRDRLESLAAKLRDKFGVQTQVLIADLTDPGGLAEVEAFVSRDDALQMLVNNAGFGGYNPFASIEPKIIDNLIEIHIHAVARLTRAALPGMVSRGIGSVINIASMLAMSGTLPPNPLPHRAVYAGAKAFLVTFTQALAGELNATPIKVQVCLPGMVSTEFHAIQDFNTDQIGLKKMTAEDVVTASLSGLAKGEVMCIPALADASLIEQLGEAQRAVFKAGALQGVALAERYR
jgi:short-subunit dehydrogenase